MSNEEHAIGRISNQIAAGALIEARRASKKAAGAFWWAIGAMVLSIFMMLLEFV